MKKQQLPNRARNRQTVKDPANWSIKKSPDVMSGPSLKNSTTDMSTNVGNRNQLMQVLQQTPASAIAELDFVRDKYITNYNACHREKVGDLMYHRQVIHFKQLITASDPLRNCDPFSLYACFATAAVNGYSLDPQDNEVYLVALKGKACLWRQAGAHVRRLQRTNQILYADQAKLVYQGDEFEVVNGRVIKHVERFQTEILVAGYVRFQLDEKGNDRYFVYRKSDWESWRKKSQVPNGDNWNNNGQPAPGFLRTKIVKHACLEKCWATGSTPANVEAFEDIEIDADDIVTAPDTTNSLTAEVIKKPAATPVITSSPAAGTPPADDAFVGNTAGAGNGVQYTDDDF